MGAEVLLVDWMACSTPEGIGAGRRRIRTAWSLAIMRSAQRPKASERGEARSRPSQESALIVLNARRHRSGEKPLVVPERLRLHAVLNARRHRSGEKFAEYCGVRDYSGAQRPKASERGEGLCVLFGGEFFCAQRPKASERGEVARRQRSSSVHACSTPEGIGAGRSPENGVLRYAFTRCSTPEGIGAGRSRASGGGVLGQPKLTHRGQQKLTHPAVFADSGHVASAA